jgi:hypothetical protein
MDEDELTGWLSPPPVLPWLRCAECRQWSDGHARGWRLFRVGEIDPDDTPELVTFCPDCWDREFGA